VVVDTIWVLGDQLDRTLGALGDATPQSSRVVMVESVAKMASQPWHRQRAHLILTAMRRFAGDLADEGFEVDYRHAPTMAAGIAGHIADHTPDRVLATEANSFAGQRLLEQLGVVTVASDHFLCHRNDFAQWASGRKLLRMEDFYRVQRRRLGYLMDGDEPAGGRWNFDADNREPPPTDGRAWPTPPVTPLDATDHAVLEGLPPTCWGADPDGTWATSRREALRRLDHAITRVLPVFGPHEDAMLSTNWHLAHTLLSPYMNLGLLRPDEVCDAVEAAYRAGDVPIASAEGFIRQVIGWREYVWGTYWLWMPEYAHANELGAHRPLPPVFTTMTTGIADTNIAADTPTTADTDIPADPEMTADTSTAPNTNLSVGTEMNCVRNAMADIHDYGWTHHIQRLMVIGNLCLIAGVDPWAVTRWMWSSFVDGAEWVMLPNVVGMALHADGGRMASKPYAAGGNYIDRMSDYCGDCRFDRRKRTGPDACPFTTLYWDFIARHDERFVSNARMARQVHASRRLVDLPAVRERATEVLDALDAGTL
jgi:deoxyribodipyrimidine photolyase-related protein